MKIVIRWFLIPLFQFLVVGAVAADETICVKIGYPFIEPDGVFSSTEEERDSDIDFEKPLDFDGSREPAAEAALQLGDLRLAAGYLPLDFSGRGSLTSAVLFGGRTFASNDQVASDVDAVFFDFSMAYYLLNVDDLPVRVQIGPEIAAKVVSGDAAVRSETTGVQAQISGTASLPTLGGRLRVGMADSLGFAARIGYTELAGSSFLDLDGQVEFSPLPLVGIYAGYRYLDLDVDESGVLLDSRFVGPYGGVLVRF